MNYLPFAFIIISTLSLIITFFSIKRRKTAIETVNDMGLGWNLGNSFECFTDIEEIKTPDDQLTLWGNVVPTKKMFTRLKKYGFKTIRVPITWVKFMDDSGNISPEWMSRVKEVVKWITKEKMYCIINVHHDGAYNNWLTKGVSQKDKYINVWTQISNEFKNYNEYLVFESMNDVEYKIGDNYDYLTLLTLTQAFVDVVRNSGGYNGDRLLLISGANKDIDKTCSSEYKLPIDPSNKLAISIVYNLPKQFSIEPEDDPWTWVNEEGIHVVPCQSVWGNENDYKEMFTNLETMKEVYADKGIAVIIVEVDIITEQKKEIDSIRRYLYTIYAMTKSYDGIMACLWDTSEKSFGDFNHYDRKNDRWYDDAVRDNFKKISQGKFIKPSDFFVFTNTETVRTPNIENHMRITIGVKKVLTVTFNAYITAQNLTEVTFAIVTSNIFSNRAEIIVNANQGKKRYDGSYTFTYDVSQNDNNDYMQIEKGSGKDYITFNFFTVEFAQSYTFFDYNSYIKSIS